jgi:hypothetical protein
MQTQVLGLQVRSSIVENQCHSGAREAHERALWAIPRVSKLQTSIMFNTLIFGASRDKRAEH